MNDTYPQSQFNYASCILSATLSPVVSRARITVEFGTTSRSLGEDHVVQSGEVAAPKARLADVRGHLRPAYTECSCSLATCRKAGMLAVLGPSQKVECLLPTT